MSNAEFSLSNETESRRLTVDLARDINEPIETVLVRLSDGKPVEELTLLRYAGRYRGEAEEAFAIKNGFGKFQVRGATELGLTKASGFCLIASIPPAA